MSHALSAGADLVAATQRYRVRENTICHQWAFQKIAEDFDIGLPETRSGATGPSPFKVGDNQRPERTMSGVRKPSPESSVPGVTLTGGKEAESILQGIWKPIRA